MVSGILKRDRVVRSPSNNNNIIPDEAIARTIKPLIRILLTIVCHKKSFLFLRAHEQILELAYFP